MTFIQVIQASTMQFIARIKGREHRQAYHFLSKLSEDFIHEIQKGYIMLTAMTFVQVTTSICSMD